MRELICEHIAPIGHIVRERRTIGSAIILVFICYTAIVIISELKKHTKLGYNLRKQVNEMGYS